MAATWAGVSAETCSTVRSATAATASPVIDVGLIAAILAAENVISASPLNTAICAEFIAPICAVDSAPTCVVDSALI